MGFSYYWSYATCLGGDLKLFPYVSHLSLSSLPISAKWMGTIAENSGICVTSCIRNHETFLRLSSAILLISPLSHFSFPSSSTKWLLQILELQHTCRPISVLFFHHYTSPSVPYNPPTIPCTHPHLNPPVD